MINVSFLNLKWYTILLRYFLMMFCVIVGVLMDMPLITVLAFPIFISAILGIGVHFNTIAKAKELNVKMAK